MYLVELGGKLNASKLFLELFYIVLTPSWKVITEVLKLAVRQYI